MSFIMTLPDVIYTNLQGLFRGNNRIRSRITSVNDYSKYHFPCNNVTSQLPVGKRNKSAF